MMVLCGERGQCLNCREAWEAAPDVVEDVGKMVGWKGYGRRENSLRSRS